MSLERASAPCLRTACVLLFLTACATAVEPKEPAAPAAQARAALPLAKAAAPLPAPVSVPAELAALQQAYALHYFEPRVHFRLARYYRDAGELLLAYSISESAFSRFTAFGLADRKQLKSVFDEVMNDRPPFDDSPAAEAALRAQLAKAPRDAALLMKLADVYISRSAYPQAVPLLERAIAAKPADFTQVAVLARVQSESGKAEQAQQLITRWAQKHRGTKEALRVQVGLAPQPQQRGLLEAAVREYPEDGELLFDLAARVQEEDGAEKAEPLFVRAATLAPTSAHVQGWVGRFFLKAREQPERSLPYYLRAYLLQPDFYDTESVHSRIRRYAPQQARAAFAQQGEDVAWALRQTDPLQASAGLDVLFRTWDARHLPAVMALMAHDDERVSAGAMQLLQKHADRSALEAPVRALLADASPRRRGLAAYLAVHLWGKDAFPMMQALFAEKEDLLRYDAISALLMSGDREARALATAQLEREPGAGFKSMLEEVRAQPSP